MVKRIFAISFIYVCTVVAWLFLAGTIMVRSETQDTKLRRTVGQLWGTEQIQKAPQVYSTTTTNHREYLALASSEIEVDLKLDHRRKGLLWYSTYQVNFSGKYRIVNDADDPRQICVDFSFPAVDAVYDNFRFIVGEEEVKEVKLTSGKLTRTLELAGDQTQEIQISYSSQGLDTWQYGFGESVNQIRNFLLVVNTDFEDIDFPPDGISPTEKQSSGDGWRLTWKYTNLLTGADIGVVLPQKLNPGPWVSKVTATAPISLFLFFFLMMVFTTIKNIRLHPMHYFFIATAFFSFHLLLSYLVDHVSIDLAFGICSAVSVFLLVSYMRLVVGVRLAFVEIALAQLVYLVFFSYTFFFKGYTGLAITILCICTLFVVMQCTGKMDWEKVFTKNSNGTNTNVKINQQ
jgi:hypothetical protein